MPFDTNAAQALLGEVFAPWIQALDLQVTQIDDAGATLRLPNTPSIAREGGIVCGQALMALADTAAVIGVAAVRGGHGPITTVSQHIDLMRPLAEDALCRASVVRLGRSMAFVHCEISGADSGKAIAGAQMTLALPPG